MQSGMIRAMTDVYQRFYESTQGRFLSDYWGKKGTGDVVSGTRQIRLLR